MHGGADACSRDHTFLVSCIPHPRRGQCHTSFACVGNYSVRVQEGSGDTLPDEKCVTILRKLSKVQQESIDMYRQGGRDDLVQKEQLVKDLIDSFLPQVGDAPLSSLSMK